MIDLYHTHFKLYHVATTRQLIEYGPVSQWKEQMPTKGIVVSLNLTKSVGFSTGLETLPTSPRA